MKRMLAAAAGTSLLLMLGGCGGDDDKVEDAGSAAGGTSLAGSPGSDQNDTPMGDAAPGSNAPEEGVPELVTPRAGMKNLRPVHFEKTERVDQRTVLITFYGGVEPCDVLDSVKVKYATDDVTISLFSGSDPAKPDAVCIEIAKLKQVEVKLTEDLGEREIKDGAPNTEVGSKANTGAMGSGSKQGKISGDTPAVELTPKAGQAELHSISWDRYEMIDDTTVRIYFMAGVEPCNVLDSVKLVYAQEVIRVALFMGSDPTQKDAVCPALARMAYTDIKLKEPVGDREVVDDTTTD